ncbi:aminomethyl-transferring glycine dehydrogenase subunit GcvPB [Rubinisphaera margarita]|uniref:aminomethyl-transferring glycine dehydrogenase subunit GcvPB n=1 Tax=Rubinisphaera margarita TaxID=2909586 RepID=UPI001EE80266|nr:aminomethyl-transferring glycine dehydrogenase subunit GcvPB [Rubinisphaera margarita]MCG6155144.1 aminomethyl-transferring glycine dehydrogenase subunit GcvPB [Rubinisphaera margarita]
MENQIALQLLQDLSVPGRRATAFPPEELAEAGTSSQIPDEHRADHTLSLPELSEGDIVRHYVSLSQRNMSVDTHFYPLGSCTMKYNPKRHERWAGMNGFINAHPYAETNDIQGLLAVLYEMQEMLGEIAGLPSVSLHPAAGAQGEFAAILTASAYFASKGEDRKTVVFPASAHGTNPASAAMAGYKCVQLKPSSTGLVNLDDLKQHLSEEVAVFMITNPNTIGLFEKDIQKISEMLHDVGGLVYIDGANMNAILGKTRPGDFGGDMMHYNVHKTFTGPHGAGGPGAGPIAVRDFLGDYLPGPIVTRETDAQGKTVYKLSKPPKSVGQLRSFIGNIGILLRGYFYIRTLGGVGLREVSEHAVLNANYLLSQLKDVLDVPNGDRCMHEFVASAAPLKKQGVTAMDIAKRLLDYGFHAPTVYFPLVIPEAMMMEPTETESKLTLDRFADTIKAILAEDPETLRSAPLTTPVSRPDEVKAAREPVLSYCPCPTAFEVEAPKGVKETVPSYI